MKNTSLKSIWAVLAGFITVALLSVATDAFLETLGIFPTATDPSLLQPWMLVFALLYRSLFTMVGGYLTARLAPKNEMRHVAALMILGGLGGAMGLFVGWNMPHLWYPILLAITGPAFVWLGGKFCQNKTSNA